MTEKYTNLWEVKLSNIDRYSSLIKLEHRWIFPLFISPYIFILYIYLSVCFLFLARLSKKRAHSVRWLVGYELQLWAHFGAIWLCQISVYRVLLYILQQWFLISFCLFSFQACCVLYFILLFSVHAYCRRRRRLWWLRWQRRWRCCYFIVDKIFHEIYGKKVVDNDFGAASHYTAQHILNANTFFFVVFCIESNEVYTEPCATHSISN